MTNDELRLMIDNCTTEDHIEIREIYLRTIQAVGFGRTPLHDDEAVLRRLRRGFPYDLGAL